METFSQRMGLKPNKRGMQLEGMDQALRNRLWNALDIRYWSRVRIVGQGPFAHYETDSVNRLYGDLIDLYFKKPLDAFEDNYPDVLKSFREYFFKCEWYDVYSFIEFVAQRYQKKDVNDKFMRQCNTILEEEMSGYRFIGGQIVPISSEVEMEEIEEALENTSPLGGVNTHLKTALKLMADRENPDYRNSIKESISAVEATCKLITGDENASLGQALKKIKKEITIKPALKKAFDALYGYTNTEDGVRHGSPNEANISLEDARFMLVSCSAFVNYLIVKADKAGIEIQNTR